VAEDSFSHRSGYVLPHSEGTNVTFNYDVNGRRSVQVVTGLTAAGRVASGVAAFVRPEGLPRMLGLDRGTSRRSTFLVRLFAVREAALGVGTVHALQTGRDVRPWLVATAISDAGDALAFAAATRERVLRPSRGVAVSIAALAGVVGAAVTLRRMRG
jgi:hypothetical protein